MKNLCEAYKGLLNALVGILDSPDAHILRINQDRVDVALNPVRVWCVVLIVTLDSLERNCTQFARLR